MPNNLLVTAASWVPRKVACTFAVTADDKALAAVDPAQQIYDIPAGTAEVEVTATPTVKNVYWPTTINLTVAGDGSISPQASSTAWVTVTAAAGGASRVTQATINMTRFREITPYPLGLLQTIPVPRGERAPGEAELKGIYGTWPPADWTVDPLPRAVYLDRSAPWNEGASNLNFVTDHSLKVNVENIVLELAASEPPRLYGVTWPTAITPKKGDGPPPILLFLRQTGGQDADHGVFTGGAVATQPYPFNFDYVERCLFESLHYGEAPAWKAPPLIKTDTNPDLKARVKGKDFFNFSLRPKGVPYQVARSGAGDKLVTVFPVAAIGKEYGVLNDMAATGKILEELQAFMFWRAGIRMPPASVGPTMIAAFSSATGWPDKPGGPPAHLLAEWLVASRNRTSSFFKDTVKAIYFLDPPYVGLCVTAALSWADWAGPDKRIRLYSRKSEKETGSAFRKLLGLKPGDPALPTQPYVFNSPSGTRTLASLSLDSWQRALNDIAGDKFTLAWWDVHHFIPAFALTHALAQGDI